MWSDSWSFVTQKSLTHHCLQTTDWWFPHCCRPSAWKLQTCETRWQPPPGSWQPLHVPQSYPIASWTILAGFRMTWSQIGWQHCRQLLAWLRCALIYLAWWCRRVPMKPSLSTQMAVTDAGVQTDHPTPCRPPIDEPQLWPRGRYPFGFVKFLEYEPQHAASPACQQIRESNGKAVLSLILSRSHCWVENRTRAAFCPRQLNLKRRASWPCPSFCCGDHVPVGVLPHWFAC